MSGSRPMRSAPADLAEQFEAIGTLRGLSRHYTADKKIVMRWLSDANIPLKRRQLTRLPVPADLAERAKVMGKTELAAHYNVGAATLNRWLLESGVTPVRRYTLPPDRSRPVPDDFAQMARRLTIPGLERHYATGRKTVVRWISETGVQARTWRHDPSAFRMARAPSQPSVQRVNNDGPEEDAAFVLRKWGPVYRCQASGKAHHQGTHWRIGNTVLTGEELIARAARKTA